MGVPECEPFETFDDLKYKLVNGIRERFMEISALWIPQQVIPGSPVNDMSLYGLPWPKIRSFIVASFQAAGFSDRQIQECVVKGKECELDEPHCSTSGRTILLISFTDIRKEIESRNDFWAGVGVHGVMVVIHMTLLQVARLWRSVLFSSSALSPLISHQLSLVSIIVM